MQIQLTEKEIKILKDYQNHIWEISKISYTLRGILSVILEENTEELKMVKRELIFEAKKNK